MCAKRVNLFKVYMYVQKMGYTFILNLILGIDIYVQQQLAFLNLIYIISVCAKTGCTHTFNHLMYVNKNGLHFYI
jgi:hypothetical protein